MGKASKRKPFGNGEGNIARFESFERANIAYLLVYRVHMPMPYTYKDSKDFCEAIVIRTLAKVFSSSCKPDHPLKDVARDRSGLIVWFNRCYPLNK